MVEITSFTMDQVRGTTLYTLHTVRFRLRDSTKLKKYRMLFTYVFPLRIIDRYLCSCITIFKKHLSNRSSLQIGTSALTVALTMIVPVVRLIRVYDYCVERHKLRVAPVVLLRIEIVCDLTLV